MKRILVLLALIAAPAFGQHAKQTNVKAQDQSYKVNVNVGGTPTDVFTISGAGAFTLGVANGVQSHVVNGNTVTVVGTGPNIQNVLSVKGATDAGSWPISQLEKVGTGTTYQIIGFAPANTYGTGQGANDFIFRVSGSAQGYSFITNSSSVIGKADSNGLWTLGAANGTQAHVVNGTITQASSSSGGVVSSLRNTSNGTTSYTSLRLANDLNTNVRTLEIDYGSSGYTPALLNGGPTGESASISTSGAFPLSLGTSNVYRGGIDAAGLWTIGASGSNVTHVMNGGALRFNGTAVTGTGNSIGASWHFNGAMLTITSGGTANVTLPASGYFGTFEIACHRVGNGGAQTARLYHISHFSGNNPTPAALLTSSDSTSLFPFTVSITNNVITVTNTDASSGNCFYFGNITNAG